MLGGLGLEQRLEQTRLEHPRQERRQHGLRRRFVEGLGPVRGRDLLRLRPVLRQHGRQQRLDPRLVGQRRDELRVDHHDLVEPLGGEFLGQQLGHRQHLFVVREVLQVAEAGYQRLFAERLLGLAADRHERRTRRAVGGLERRLEHVGVHRSAESAVGPEHHEGRPFDRTLPE